MGTETIKKENTPRKKLIIGIIALIIIALIGTGLYTYRLLNKKTFHKGLVIDGISLDNMNKKEALDKIKAKNQPKLDKMQIILSYGDKKWTYDYNSIDAKTDVEEVIDKAYSIGREGSLIERLKEIYKVSKKTEEYETNLLYDVSLIDGEIKELAKEIYEEPVDATIDFQPNKSEKFVFTPEEIGKGMLVEKTMDEIKDKVDSNDFSIYYISTEELYPEFTLDQVKTWTSRIARYSTSLNGVANRNHNISLSSEAFYNVRIDPDEEYSMNEATGPRGSAEGYKDASVIKQGKKFEAEPGGGNCQSSTTLYGAAMRADLDIVTRLPHSIKSNYTDIGTDAMVDYPWADLKFKNNRDSPIFITRYISGGKLHVEIYGKADTEYDDIKIISEKISESNTPEYNIIEDSTLAEGTEVIDWYSRAEIKAVSYKVYYKDGKEVKRIKEAHSTYPGVKGQKRIGTKKKQIEKPKELPKEEPKQEPIEEIIENTAEETEPED